MIELETPFALLALPLIALPLLASRRDVHTVGSVAWLPRDRIGEAIDWLWRAIAALSIALVIVGLAGPGTPETRAAHVGSGAEISILLDRSSSMDETTRRNVPSADGSTSRITKKQVVRDALTQLIAERPDNRYALTMFNAAPMRIAPFGEDPAIVQAGLDASDIGRGPGETDMAQALLAAIDSFEGRAYTGSRALLLVSDGGARLDATVQAAVAEGLERLDIALYFIYVKSGVNNADLSLDLVGTDVDATREEVALHLFFSGLATDYRVYEAADPESMAAAIQAIDQQENLPLTTFRRVPHIDHRSVYWGFALAGTLVLLALDALRRRGAMTPA